MSSKNIQKIFVALVFAFIFGYLASQIPWSLIFADTMVGGGDTGSHNYIVYYAQEIFPKIKWWSPDWYAGFPFLYFYPPLLYYVTVLLGYLIPLNVAFKLITLSGTFLLPLAVFWCLRFLNFKFPIPSLGALFSLAYLFLEQFSIYGGNIPSTLSGEFSYSFAFALFFFFVGLLIKGIRENRYLAANILILSLMVLSHPFSVIISVLLAVLILAWSIWRRESKRVFGYLAKVFIAAFGLTAFWSLPFLTLLPYTAKMSWTKVINWAEIFPSGFMLFEIIAALGILYAFWKKDKKILPILGIILVALIPFLLLNHSSIWNTRFLAFILMPVLMLAAYGLGKLIQHSARWIGYIFLLMACIGMIFVYLPMTVSYIPHWMVWNYEGLQSKGSWPELKSLSDFLRNLPYGRVMWEYRAEYDKFGTPRVLENLPIFTDYPTFEGLLIESSASGYFHFINQAETTYTPTSAIAGLEYPIFNFENGLRHLRYFGAQYFVAYSDEIKALANEHLEKIGDAGGFSVYQISDSDLVAAIPQFELVPKTATWLERSMDWYKGMDFSMPLVFYQNEKEKEELSAYAANQRGDDIEKSTVRINKITNDSLSFSTDYIGVPHLVKYTYFPGWRVSGAQGPYLISPSFMMVIPVQKEVILEYGYNAWDRIGIIISLVSLVLFFLMIGGSIFPKSGKLSRCGLFRKRTP